MSRRKLLVPVDGSDFSRAVFGRLRGLFEPADTEVVLVHVAAEPEGVYERAARPAIPSEAGEGLLKLGHPEPKVHADEAWSWTLTELAETFEPDRRELSLLGFATDLVFRHGDPAQEIADLAEELEVDAIVMATHGRSGLSRAVLGSVAERVLRQAVVPVVTVRPAPVASEKASVLLPA